jgi:5-methylcytosine-specific restriction endonuclease McrA
MPYSYLGGAVMPFSPLGACRFPRCSRRGSHRGYCAEHAKQRERARGSAAARGYDAAWRKVRAEQLKAHPWCVECGLEATDVDHIVSVRQAPERRLDRTNLRSLCHRHHSQRTAIEQSHWDAALAKAVRLNGELVELERAVLPMLPKDFSMRPASCVHPDLTDVWLVEHRLRAERVLTERQRRRDDQQRVTASKFHGVRLRDGSLNLYSISVAAHKRMNEALGKRAIPVVGEARRIGQAGTVR